MIDCIVEALLIIFGGKHSIIVIIRASKLTSSMGGHVIHHVHVG